MGIAYLIIGIIAGASSTGISLLAGNPFWFSFLLYPFGGALAILAFAALFFLKPRYRFGSGEEIAPVTSGH